MSRSEAYAAPVAEARFELRKKGSRFLAILRPVRDEDEVQELIRVAQRRYAAASHVCWAWRLGSPPREGRSDAGEPSGTAGTPMLLVLRGSGLCDALVLVVRWFGGVKLGKGGLARAYAGAVRGVVERVELVERQATTKLLLSLPYERLGDLKRLVHPPEVEILEEEYGDSAKVTLRVHRARAADIERALVGLGIAVGSAGV